MDHVADFDQAVLERWGTDGRMKVGRGLREIFRQDNLYQTNENQMLKVKIHAEK